MGLEFLLLGSIDRLSIALALAGAILLLGAVLSLRRLQGL
jgi:hypothetical protein